MAYGNKNKDDMGNKGRGGRGPKPMKGARKAARKEKREEKKQTKEFKKVVNRLNSKQKYKTPSREGLKKQKPTKSNQLPESFKAELVKTTGEAMVKSLQKMVKPTLMHKKAGGMIKPEDPAPVTRYQGSTPKIGGNKKIEQISNEQKSYGQKRSEELRSAHEGYTGSTTDKGIEARYGKAAAQKKKS